MLCAKFRANQGKCLGGVRKSRFTKFGEFAKKKKKTGGGNGLDLYQEIQQNSVNMWI